MINSGAAGGAATTAAAAAAAPSTFPPLVLSPILPLYCFGFSRRGEFSTTSRGVFAHHRLAQAFPALFPMYTVSSDILLSMTKIEPHEKLKAAHLGKCIQL